MVSKLFSSVAPCDVQTVGQYEDAIFQKRMRELRRQRDRMKRQERDKEIVSILMHFIALKGGGWCRVVEELLNIKAALTTAP